MTNSDTHADDIHRCPICAEPFRADDTCVTDITEGTCQAKCLEGSPVVDLETGEETGGEVDTYPYRDVMESSPDHLPIELDGISRQLGEKGGCWRSCSGCHELSEGVPTGPHSSIMRCHLGMGCHECGGIGAVWDTTDYAAMGEFMAADTPPPTHISVGTIDVDLEWIAGARPPVHPEPMFGRRTFSSFEAAVAFFGRQAPDAKLVSLIENHRSVISKDRTEEAYAALSSPMEGGE